MLRLRLPLALGVLLALAPLVRAQEDAAEEEAPRRRLPPARVTAVRMAELPESPSSFATVLEADDYQGEHKTVDDLLSRSVGVQVRRFGGPGSFSEVSIRGSSSDQVVVLMDGVRINTAQSGTVDLSTLPMPWVERVEVARGGGAVWAGSGAVGGVVNVVTRRPGPEPETWASFAGGSWDTWEGALSHSRRFPVFAEPGEEADGDFLLGYAGLHSEGDWKFQTVKVVGDEGFDPIPSRETRRINNEVDQHSVFGRGGLELGENARLSLSDHFFYVSRGQPGPDNRPAEPDAGQNREAHDRVARNVAALSLEHDALPGDMTGLARVSYLYERSKFRDPEPDLGDPIKTRQRNRSGASHLSLEGEGELWGTSHLATVAGDARYESLSSSDSGFNRRWTLAIAGQDEVGLFADRLQVIPGLRFEWSDDFGSEWVPRSGVVYQPFQGLRLKSNIERAYRQPDFDELFFPNKGFIRGNPNLDPERSLNVDAGFELGLAALGWFENLSLQSSFFYSDIENSIVFQRINPDTVQATNTDDATVKGVEVAGSIGFRGWVELSGNYTWQDAELDRRKSTSLIGQPGSELPGRAKHEYSFRLGAGPPSQLVKVVFEVSHTSSIPVNFSDVARVSSRTVYDASISLDFAQLWRLESPLYPEQLVGSFIATNFTDQSVRDSVGFPQPGRSLTFQLEGRW